jgi:hypothetical protein
MEKRMNKITVKIIAVFCSLGILVACNPGQTPTSTNSVPMTGVIQTTSSIVAAPSPISALVPSSPSIGILWEFNSVGDTEGWVSQNEINSLVTIQGNLTGQSTGNDPFLFGQQFIIDANGFSSIETRMKATSGEAAQIFFTTSLDTIFNEAKSLRFIINGDGQFHTYVLDMSTITGWNGTITQLRLDPTETTGSFAIDYIRILKPVGFSWEFENDGDANGWVATQEITDLQVSRGNLTGQSTGNDPILFGQQFTIDANGFSSIEIRMKATSGEAAQIFFTTSSDTFFDEAKSLRFIINGDGQFHTYVLDMSSNPGWKGAIVQFRLDPTEAPASFEVDYIRILR